MSVIPPIDPKTGLGTVVDVQSRIRQATRPSDAKDPLELLESAKLLFGNIGKEISRKVDGLTYAVRSVTQNLDAKSEALSQEVIYESDNSNERSKNLFDLQKKIAYDFDFSISSFRFENSGPVGKFELLLETSNNQATWEMIRAQETWFIEQLRILAEGHFNSFSDEKIVISEVQIKQGSVWIVIGVASFTILLSDPTLRQSISNLALEIFRFFRAVTQYARKVWIRLDHDFKQVIGYGAFANEVRDELKQWLFEHQDEKICKEYIEILNKKPRIRHRHFKAITKKAYENCDDLRSAHLRQFTIREVIEESIKSWVGISRAVDGKKNLFDNKSTVKSHS